MPAATSRAVESDDSARLKSAFTLSLLPATREPVGRSPASRSPCPALRFCHCIRTPRRQTGYLGAGGLADNGAYKLNTCTGGAHRAIDIWLFGEHHIYHGGGAQPTSAATCSGVYQCNVYDPEGALGFISAGELTLR